MFVFHWEEYVLHRIKMHYLADRIICLDIFASLNVHEDQMVS